MCGQSAFEAIFVSPARHKRAAGLRENGRKKRKPPRIILVEILGVKGHRVKTLDSSAAVSVVSPPFPREAAAR
jgi:hypothetical protein